MEITCGTDIIEIDRIKKSITERFLKEVYNESEIEYCESKKAMKYQHYAARFAAKEAIFKAISPYLQNKYDITWKNMEILNNKQGRPYANINKDKIRDNIEIDISLAHIKEYAIANCTINKK